MKKRVKRRPSTKQIVRTYRKGKLFGKHAGTFVFRSKPTEDKIRQMRLGL